MNISFNRKRREPTHEGKMQVPYAPAKRNLSNLKWRLTLLLVLSPFIYFLAKIILALFVAPSSGFVILDSHQYQSPTDCKVKEIFVDVGSMVEAGAPIVTFEDFELEQEIAEIGTRIGDIQQISNGSISTGTYLKEQVLFARESLAQKKKIHSDIQFLFHQGAATIAELTTAENQLTDAKSRLSTREYELQQWQEENNDQLQQVNNSIAIRELQKKLDKLGEERNRLTLHAMQPGRVSEILVTEGELLQKTETAVVITKMERPMVLAYVDPKDINRVQRGEIAEIVLPSGYKIKGLVEENPGFTGRLPAYLSSPMLGRERKIIVFLQPLEEFPGSEIVAGLPVKVYFQTFAIEIFEKVRGYFRS